MANFLTDIFTGNPAKEAAEKTRGFLANTLATGRNDLANAYGTGANAINAGANEATAAYAPLSALGSKYGGATSTALDALGINGPEGVARANAAFTASPAYNFNLTQGLEAINRRRAAGGMLNSGNADRDAQEYGAGLASREFGDWRNALLGFTNPELSATGGAASGIAGVAQNRGQSLANLANLQAQGNVNLASRLADPYANTYGNVAAAEMGGSGNLMNLGLNVAKLLAGGAGYGAGGGSFLPKPSSTAFGIG